MEDFPIEPAVFSLPLVKYSYMDRKEDAMSMVSIEIPQDVIHATRMSPEELKRELAIHLFREGKLSFGKAREMTGMTVWEFQNLLGSRNIQVHYDVKEYNQDLETLKDIGRLP
jgi:predicted HTH domain antitoxin